METEEEEVPDHVLVVVVQPGDSDDDYDDADGDDDDDDNDDDDDGDGDDRVDDDNDHMQSITEQCPPALLLSGVRLQLRGGCTTHGSRSTKMPSFTSFPSGIFHK